MLKKILPIFSVIFVIAVAAATYFFSRQAPQILVSSIKRSFGKEVLIRSIDYSFPSSFRLNGLEIKEADQFSGETSFAADSAHLNVSLWSLLEKKLVLRDFDVENADVIIRKSHGKLIHPFSIARKPDAADSSLNREAVNPKNDQAMSLVIRQLILKKSRFKFIDYDIQKDGFVIAFENIDALISNVRLPFSDEKTFYKISADMLQGETQKKAQFKISGHTQFRTMDSDVNVVAQEVYLPYFQPYYLQVTPVAIEKAFLGSRTNILLEHNDLTINADLEVADLALAPAASEQQIFGLRTDEMLSYLKDRSDRLKLQIVAQWNIADQNLNARDIIRRSIEKSLKKTVVGNVGEILDHALTSFSGVKMEKNKQSLEQKIAKLKDILKQ